jgi:hypothetical protein
MRILKWSTSLVPSLALAVVVLGVAASAYAAAPPAPNPQSGAVGVQGQIGGAPPSQGATISVPGNGQRFSNLPITISGLCPKGLLVEIFNNGVFVGSVQCTTGSYSIQIDLFEGQNDLIVRVFDALNQAGPDSATVTVFYNSVVSPTTPKPTLTTAYAKRGADPGTTLSWPITLSGGKGPYAISVDWGDKSPLQLISRANGGTFNIEHVYTQSGVFNVTVKTTDSEGNSAFLQMVGISNGPIKQTNNANGAGGSTKTQNVIIWWPLAITFALTFVAFWLGKKHQLQTIRDRLHRGERPI